MALAAGLVIEVQNGGASTNGGGFVTGSSGTDFSTQAGTQYSVTDGVTAGTTAVTSATANFGTDVVGNLVYVQGGTATLTAVWRQITARVSNLQITVDAATGLGASTGVTLHIGGALDSLGTAGQLTPVSGNIIFIKQASTYSISSATANASGGTISTANAILIVGYTSTRTVSNTDTKPTLQFSATTITMFPTTANAIVSYNVIYDGNAQTSSKLCAAIPPGFVRCVLNNFTAANQGSGVYINCSATGCTAAIFSGTNQYCEAFANTATPFTGSSIYCLSYANTGASTDGFSIGTLCFNCTAYNNGRNGFIVTGANNEFFVNCIAESNAGAAFSITTPNFNKVFINCATFGNGSTFSSATRTSINDIAGSSSFFTNAAGNDFSLNNTANAGALLRATGYPGAFPRGTSTSFQDIGAIQHADPASVTFCGTQTSIIVNRGGVAGY